MSNKDYGSIKYVAEDIRLMESDYRSHSDDVMPEPRRQCPDIIKNKKWWSLWLGLTCLVTIIIVVFAGYRGAPAGPTRWKSNPLDAWNNERVAAHAIVAVGVWCITLFGYSVVEVLKPSSKRSKYPSDHPFYPSRPKPIKKFICEFGSSLFIISILGVLAWWIAEQSEIHRYGLTFEVWGLVFGMIFAHMFKPDKMPGWLGLADKGEDYIKVGLVLLGLDIQTIGKLAGPGLLTSWVVTPIVLFVSYFFISSRLLSFDPQKNGTFTKSLAMMLSVGLAVCGSSAATAVHGAIPESSAPQRDNELKLTIGLLNVFTIVQMIAWPYFAWAVKMPLAVAAGWFGGSIDGTGNVVASGAIFDELIDSSGDYEYAGVEIASTVKMIQNTLIGPVAILVTIYWITYVEKRERGGTTCWSNVMEIWKRFPKFVIGFLITAVVLTLIKAYADTELADTFDNLLISVRSWWFTIGFVGVGLGTHLVTMYQKLKGGQAMVLYTLGQGFDLLLTFAVSYLSFEVIYKGEFGKI